MANFLMLKVDGNLFMGRGDLGRTVARRGGESTNAAPTTQSARSPELPQCAFLRACGVDSNNGDDDQKNKNNYSPLPSVQRLCAGFLAATLVFSTPSISSSGSRGYGFGLPTWDGWVWGSSTSQAQAAGLLQMPPPSLGNRYFLVRAGNSYFESQGIIHTNPVSKTSVDSGLSAEGKRQTVRAAVELQRMGACDDNCWIWPSITQRSYQTAEAIAVVMNINYRLYLVGCPQNSRIVPEYSFLDARGLGAYENRELSAINEVYSSDLVSSTWKPPKFTDGTPNESVTDVLVRVTQLMSILETQYQGESVIIVSPDSDNLSILQAALTGQDLKKHSSLAFAPGEVRRVDKNDIPAKRPFLSGKFKLNLNQE